jgi:glycosyltransferase 2 family protein
LRVKAVWNTLLRFGREHKYLLTLLFKYGIGLGLLTFLVISNWAGFKDVFSRSLRVEPLLWATAIATVGLIITFLRWHYLVVAVGLPFTRYNAIRLGLVGYYFNTFMPGSIGGDIIKGYAIAKEQSRQTVAVATVLVDRIIGLWALVWFVAIIGTVFWLANDPILQNVILLNIVRFTIVVVVASMAFWFAIGSLSNERADRIANWLAGVRKIGGSLAELWRACWMYRQKSRAVLVAMIMSLVGHTGWVLVFHLTMTAFNYPNPEQAIGTFPEHMIVVPVGMTVQAVPLVPGGIGVGEAMYGELYVFIDRPRQNGVWGCLLQRVIFYGLALVGFIFYSRMRANIVKIENEIEETRHPHPHPPPVDAERPIASG